ncbi:hypothetical protein [Hamadaea tsunoensis]|uniref:hypothetical protein n=1 Tax=Hamadaea tsunoensis TaxID=53368 RepID=UPI000425163A|nr:hypothetical protein [Hamadaea tsunoensis]
MDTERGYPDGRWYPDDRGAAEPDRRDRRGGFDDRSSRSQRGGYADNGTVYGAEPGGYGGPEQRYGGYGEAGYGETGYADNTYGRTEPAPAFEPPRSAVPIDPRTPPPPSGFTSHSADPGPAEQPSRSQRGGEVYRSRKPLHAAALGIGLGILELVMLLVLLRGIVGLDAHRVLAGGLTVIALPLLGIGMYALITGAGHGGPKAFLRPPLAYLPVALVLLIAAGAAA